MRAPAKLILVFLVAGAGLAIAVRGGRDGATMPQGGPASPIRTPASIPRLVDLGAGKCIPCKAMAPILEQLRADYSGRLEVTFIDVWKKPDEARAHGIQMIARWKALGVEL